MNNVRDAGAEIVGSAEEIFAKEGVADEESRAPFVAREQRFLLLFAHNDFERESFRKKIEALRAAAESKSTTGYYDANRDFTEAVRMRVLEEWNKVKGVI